MRTGGRSPESGDRATWSTADRPATTLILGAQVIENFADRLIERCRTRGTPICVGIDPVYERLPASVRGGVQVPSAEVDAEDAVESIARFVLGVLEAVAPHVACVKFQSACFERYRWRGIEAYDRLISAAKGLDLLVIGDAKRGDIGISAGHYAAACLADSKLADLGKLPGPDALTVNSYLGADALGPFMQVAADQGKGLFALVRTSNPGSDAVQAMALAEGGTVATAIAGLIDRLGSEPRYLGDGGYSLLGAVVGATKPAEIARLRALMPRQVLLVPGFGAQGGGAEDVKACFNPDGQGAVVSASRSVIYAYEQADSGDWRHAVRDAAVEMKDQIRAILA